MNTRRVSIPVGRRPGTILTFALLLFTAFRSARAADIVITITGVLGGGYDQFPMFGVGTKLRENAGWDLAGQNFTLVFTFDDSKGTSTPGKCNAKAASGIDGDGTQSPGKAVLTIGNVSYAFGNRRSSSGAWREVPNTCSSTSLIAFYVNEAKQLLDFAPSVDVKIIPGNGSSSSSQNPDWRAPLSTTAVDNQTSCFFISRPGDHAHEAKGCFDIKKLVISGPKSGGGR